MYQFVFLDTETLPQELEEVENELLMTDEMDTIDMEEMEEEQIRKMSREEAERLGVMGY